MSLLTLSGRGRSLDFVRHFRKRWNPSNPQPLLPRRETKRDEKDIRFVDRCRIRVIGGKGGNGICCFSGLAFKEFAGPDGGNGGNGGNVIFEASNRVANLETINKKLYKAHNGNIGRSFCKTGKSGANLTIPVPPRVRIRLVEGERCSNEDKTRDLLVAKQKFVGAHGGIGGRGNFAFLSNTERAPELWEEGLAGEDLVYSIEMLQIANFALVGMPNAGKSSFLRAVSRAKPRIAEFPFTTLFPQIGVVDFEDHFRLSIAEIPGLIEGASANVGNGLAYLNHMNACSCLAFMLDLSVSDPSALGQLKTLIEEINAFDATILSDQGKPVLVIGNKIESDGARDRWMELKRDLAQFKWARISVPVSVQSRINLSKLLRLMRRTMIANSAEIQIDLTK